MKERNKGKSINLRVEFKMEILEIFKVGDLLSQVFHCFVCHHITRKKLVEIKRRNERKMIRSLARIKK